MSLAYPMRPRTPLTDAELSQLIEAADEASAAEVAICARPPGDKADYVLIERGLAIDVLEELRSLRAWKTRRQS